MNTLITVENLSKAYDRGPVLKGLNLEIAGGASSASWVPTAAARPPCSKSWRG